MRLLTVASSLVFLLSETICFASPTSASVYVTKGRVHGIYTPDDAKVAFNDAVAGGGVLLTFPEEKENAFFQMVQARIDLSYFRNIPSSLPPVTGELADLIGGSVDLDLCAWANFILIPCMSVAMASTYYVRIAGSKPKAISPVLAPFSYEVAQATLSTAPLHGFFLRGRYKGVDKSKTHTKLVSSELYGDIGWGIEF